MKRPTAEPTARWVIPYDRSGDIIELGLNGLLATAFTTLVLQDITQPSQKTLVFLAVALLLWFRVLRGAYLFLRHARYELVITNEAICWGWQHAHHRQTRILVAQLHSIHFCPSKLPEIPSRFDVITTDWKTHTLGEPLRAHADHARSIATSLSALTHRQSTAS